MLKNRVARIASLFVLLVLAAACFAPAALAESSLGVSATVTPEALTEAGKVNINIRLARYYDSRNNAEKMIEMSDTLLAVNPDDPSMLKIKARGYLLLDRYDDAMPLYRRIVDLNPSDYDSLLTLGVYYYEEMDRRSLSLQSASAQSARKYLAKANALRPTERVEAMLARLNPTTEK